MRRIAGFRDFDWTRCSRNRGIALHHLGAGDLLGLLHTKYVGFHTKQIYWCLGGVVAMFLFSLIDYHKLIDWVPWFYGFFLHCLGLMAVSCWCRESGTKRWERGAGSRSGPSCFGLPQVDEAGDDPGGSAVLREPGRTQPDLGRRSSKAFALVGIPMLLILKQPDLGTSLTYIPVLVIGMFLERNQLKAGLDPCWLRRLFWWWVDGAAGKLLKAAYQKARAYRIHQSRQRSPGNWLPGVAGKDCRRRGWNLGQGRREGHADARGIHSYSSCGFHLRGF